MTYEGQLVKSNLNHSQQCMPSFLLGVVHSVTVIHLVLIGFKTLYLCYLKQSNPWDRAVLQSVHLNFILMQKVLSLLVTVKASYSLTNHAL